MSIAASDLIADDEQSGTSTSVKSEESISLFLTAIEYTDEKGKPVTHLFGRDEDRQKHHIKVTGHRPHFFVKEDDYRPNIENHHAVYNVERVEDTTLDDDPLVKVTTYLPKQVSDLRDMFDETFEADVFYDNRFLIDQDIYTGVKITVPKKEVE